MGKSLDADNISNEEIDAVFLVNWDNINTIMHYPNRAGFDFPNLYRKKIGFTFKDKQES